MRRQHELVSSAQTVRHELEFHLLTSPDCCTRPQLSFVEMIPTDSHPKLAIKQCDTCQTYWHVEPEQLAMDEGSLVEWDWFQSLTEREAEKAVLEAVCR